MACRKFRKESAGFRGVQTSQSKCRYLVSRGLWVSYPLEGGGSAQESRPRGLSAENILEVP